MNAPAPKITPRSLLLKPRDWQQIAQRQATDMLGTPEAAEKLAEARRYGALADELEHLQSCMRQMAGLFGVPSASPAELVALVQRAIADRDDALAAESIAQLAAEAQAAPNAQEPAGWRLVPVEPTPMMVGAIADNVSLVDFKRGARDGYRAMLSAAPHPNDAG